MSAPPPVSVVMSVYNGQRFLREAITGLLDQSLGDFEFIIVDDGSTDESSAILAEYARKDGRIKLYRQENQGLIASLNKGCSIAKGKYIARMDADDVSLPMRLEKQVRYMENHPSIGILGTWLRIIDNKGRLGPPWRAPTTPGAVKWALMFENCLAHPTIMMRREVFECLGSYNPEAVNVEDYDLWVRATKLTQLANIPEVLLKRRDWEGSICSTNFQAQETHVLKTMQSMIAPLIKSNVSADSINSLRQINLGNHSLLTSLGQINTAAALIQRLYSAYIRATPLSKREIREIDRNVGKKLYTLALAANKLSTRRSLAFFMLAFRLDHRLFFSAIKTGTRALAGKPI